MIQLSNIECQSSALSPKFYEKINQTHRALELHSSGSLRNNSVLVSCHKYLRGGISRSWTLDRPPAARGLARPKRNRRGRSRPRIGEVRGRAGRVQPAFEYSVGAEKNNCRYQSRDQVKQHLEQRRFRVEKLGKRLNRQPLTYTVALVCCACPAKLKSSEFRWGLRTEAANALASGPHSPTSAAITQFCVQPAQLRFDKADIHRRR